MPGSLRVFRVFVSSTFADLTAERAALHARVFPELRRLCAGLGAQFQAIDLRWGVDTEAALDQRAVAICLEEVDRCIAVTRRPYFVLLLGDRYGWRPPPATVASDHFRSLRDRLASQDASLVDLWYVEDRNSVPPVFRLQPRRGRYIEDGAWWPVERALREALRDAAGDPAQSSTPILTGPGLTGSGRHEFGASVTELETRRALRSDQRDPGAVHAFFRTISGLPPAPAAGSYADSLDGRGDEAAADALREFRAWVRREVGPSYVRTYTAGWDAGRDADSAGPTRDHIDALCDDVRAALESAVRAELAERESAPAWQRDEEDHEAFGEDRSATFVGREAVLAELDARVTGPPAPPVLLIGAPGSGKTSVLAELAHRLRTRHDQDVVVLRFIGVTPRSAEVRTLVQDLTAALRQRRGGGGPDPPLAADAAVAAFRREIEQPRPGRGTFLVLDGLDQLGGRPLDLAWLPAEALPGVQVVVSAQAGPVADAVQRYLDAAPVVLEPMPLGEGGRLLDSWLEGVGRTLRPHQRAEVLRAFAVLGLPLHLRLAFEEARRWTSSDVVSPGTLAGDVPGLVGQLLDRLRLEHGEVLLGAALGYLAAARNGLTEDEELDLLSANPDVDREVADRFPRSPEIGGQLPPVLWARLFSDLQPYLTERRMDGRVLFGFFHQQVAEEIRARYLAEGDTARARHAELARHFGEQPLHLTAPGTDEQAPNLRKLSELAYQQAHAGLWGALFATLTDFRFLQAKAMWADVDTGRDDAGQPIRTHSGVYALQDDLDLALSLWPEPA